MGDLRTGHGTDDQHLRLAALLDTGPPDTGQRLGRPLPRRPAPP